MLEVRINEVNEVLLGKEYLGQMIVKGGIFKVIAPGDLIIHTFSDFAGTDKFIREVDQWSQYFVGTRKLLMHGGYSDNFTFV